MWVLLFGKTVWLAFFVWFVMCVWEFLFGSEDCDDHASADGWKIIRSRASTFFFVVAWEFVWQFLWDLASFLCTIRCFRTRIVISWHHHCTLFDNMAAMKKAMKAAAAPAAPKAMKKAMKAKAMKAMKKWRSWRTTNHVSTDCWKIIRLRSSTVLFKFEVSRPKLCTGFCFTVAWHHLRIVVGKATLCLIDLSGFWYLCMRFKSWIRVMIAFVCFASEAISCL